MVCLYVDPIGNSLICLAAFEILVELNGGGDFGVIEGFGRNLAEGGPLDLVVEGVVGGEKFAALGLSVEVGIQEFLDFFRKPVFVIHDFISVWPAYNRHR